MGNGEKRVSLNLGKEVPLPGLSGYDMGMYGKSDIVPGAEIEMDLVERFLVARTLDLGASQAAAEIDLAEITDPITRC